MARSRQLAYLDANVLVPSIVRSMLIIGAVESHFEVIWGRFSEVEAERHQAPSATPISTLRHRFGWKICADVEPAGMVDTDLKDRPHVSAAAAVGADVIITANIRDFGPSDLSEAELAAVHPDLFLAASMASDAYRTVLGALSAGRRRFPVTPEEIHHAEVDSRLPLLARQMDPSLGSTPGNLPRELYRGTRCIRCGADLSEADAGSVRTGLGPECWGSLSANVLSVLRI